MLAGLDAAARQAAWEEVGQALQVFESADGFEGPYTLVVTVGRKPAT